MQCYTVNNDGYIINNITLDASNHLTVNIYFIRILIVLFLGGVIMNKDWFGPPFPTYIMDQLPVDYLSIHLLVFGKNNSTSQTSKNFVKKSKRSYLNRNNK